MSQTRKAFLIIGCLLALAWLTLAPNSDDRAADVAVESLQGLDGTKNNDVTLMVINKGPTTVRLNSYVTLYWTNGSGYPTSSFYRHSKSYPILAAGESNVLNIVPPTDAKAWYPSISYETRPDLIKRFLGRVRFHLPGNWVPENAFTMVVGPTITNQTLAEESAEGETGSDRGTTNDVPIP